MELKDKRKVLIFIDWFTPAYKAGGPIKSIQGIIDALSDDFEFHIVTSAYDLGESEILNEVSPNVWKKKEGYKIIYLSRDWETKTRLLECIESVQPDVVYFNSLFSVPYTLSPLKIAKQLGVKIILAPRGMLGEGALKIKSLKKKLFIYWAKLSRLFKGITWHVSSEQEAREVQGNFGKSAKTFTALNLFETDENKWEPALKEVDSLNIYFYSRIAEKKNLHVVLDVLNITDLPNISLDIIGPIEDEAYWELCKGKIDSLGKNVTVRQNGPVSNNEFVEMVRDKHLFFFPTKHENFGHVIAESLGQGKPCIVSLNTPWHELNKKEGLYAYDLNDMNGMLKEISRFHGMNQEEYNEVSRSAINYLEMFKNTYSSKDRYSKLFE